MLSEAWTASNPDLPGPTAITNRPTLAHWMALRTEHPSSNAFCSSPNSASFSGLPILAFAVGADAARWLAGLQDSAWIRGLLPILTGMSGPSRQVCGIWTDDNTSDEVPNACVAIVAVAGASATDRETAIRLVCWLRSRRDQRGCRLPVIVTIGATLPAGFAAEVVRSGAFVIEAGNGMEQWHLHHYPLRSSIMPRRGRLICADLADHLGAWQRGGRGVLYRVPARAEKLRDWLARLKSKGHLPPASGWVLHLPRLHAYRRDLQDLDAAWSACDAAFFPADGLVTTTQPLSRGARRYDLLIVNGPVP